MTTVPEPTNVIYGLSCSCHPEDGVRYVGLTRVSLRQRMYGHMSNARRGRMLPVNAWIRKHGEPNIVSRVLEETTAEKLDDAEVRWIAHFRALSVDMLNITDGGDATNPTLWTPERRAAVGDRRRGQKASKETRLKQSAAHAGEKHWSYGLAPGTHPGIGKRQSPESIAKVMATKLERGTVYHPVWNEEDRARFTAFFRSDKHPTAKLSHAKAAEIRVRLSAGEKPIALAAEYGVNAQSISNIKLGITWAVTS